MTKCQLISTKPLNQTFLVMCSATLALKKQICTQPCTMYVQIELQNVLQCGDGSMVSLKFPINVMDTSPFILAFLWNFLVQSMILCCF